MSQNQKDKQPKVKKEVISLLQENWLSFILAALGLILVAIGGMMMIRERSVFHTGEEIIIEEKDTQEGHIFVDVQGAILNPGIYELHFSSRVHDLLIAAGGLSGEADRDWVAKNLNQAAKLKDGEKYYIPYQEEAVKGDQASAVGKININSASLSELDSLPGIGQARSQKIVDNRPYSRIEELLERKIISSSVFEEIKEKISVY